MLNLALYDDDERLMQSVMSGCAGAFVGVSRVYLYMIACRLL